MRCCRHQAFSSNQYKISSYFQIMSGFLNWIDWKGHFLNNKTKNKDLNSNLLMMSKFEASTSFHSVFRTKLKPLCTKQPSHYRVLCGNQHCRHRRQRKPSWRFAVGESQWRRRLWLRTSSLTPLCWSAGSPATLAPLDIRLTLPKPIRSRNSLRASMWYFFLLFCCPLKQARCCPHWLQV